MIHTFTLYANLNSENVIYFETKHGTDYILACDVIKDTSEGVTLTVSNIYGGWKLFLTIDVILLLGKANIKENDYYIVEGLLDNLCIQNFGESLDLILTRIEYRCDAILTSEIREFFLKRYKKITTRHHFAEKKIYDKTLYHSNKSKSKIVYDKEYERDTKGIRIELYEKDVLRYEVKLLNRHLYYNMKKYNIGRNLENYWSEELYREYFTREFKPILYSGDYYKLYDILRILSDADLKENEIADIQDFLLKISKHGITEAKNHYSKYIFAKNISILEDLNINPIIVPKNQKITLNKNKCINNPLKHVFNRSEKAPMV